MNQKKKILYLSNNFTRYGGIARLLSQKIDAWTDILDWEVTVVTVHQQGRPPVFPPKNDFKLIDLDLPGINHYKIKDLIRFYNLLKTIFKKENPDLIVSSLSGVPSLLLPFIPSRGKKLMEIHAMGESLVSPAWKYKWWIYNKYKYMLLVNEDERPFFKLKNLKIIPNFIVIDPEASKVEFKQREKLILSAGRISEQKRFIHAVKVWERIFKKFPDWRFEIYGTGDKKLLNECLEYISSHHLERIQFFPPTPHLQDIFKKASVFCLTSVHESFGMVLAEAKNAGLPAISYDVPTGPGHIISDDGILIPNGDIEAFTQELSALMKDEELRKTLSENALKNRHDFSAERVMDIWKALAEEL